MSARIVNAERPTLVFDLDDTICIAKLETGMTEEQVHDAFREAKLVEGIVIAINAFKMSGYKIAIDSARFERDRAVTEEWLKANDVAYDSLTLDKPRGRVYIDDRAFRFAGTWTIEKVQAIHQIAQSRGD